jgi:CTP:molybdopterin cytidylyltransferase MocA
LTIEAVVIAAGEGRRLRPLTEDWPKPLLPIDGRPVLATLLRELAFAARTTVVTGYLAEEVESFLEGWPGPEIRFARQPEPLGSADAVLRAIAAGVRAPLVVSPADTLYPPGEIERFAEAFERSRADGMTAPPLWAMGPELVPCLEGLPGPPFELRVAYERATERGLRVETTQIGPIRQITTPADLVRENFVYLGEERFR